MPRFYLHLRRGPDREKDQDGAEFPDLPAARIEALRLARELRASGLPGIAAGLSFEIADESGRVLLRVPFPD
jgi:hypothetical protein